MKCLQVKDKYLTKSSQEKIIESNYWSELLGAIR